MVVQTGGGGVEVASSSEVFDLGAEWNWRVGLGIGFEVEMMKVCLM